MVTGASDSIRPMTPQPLRFMCSGAVLPLQCFTLGVPTARHPADFCAALLYNAVVPCWRTFAQRTQGHVASALGATLMGCGRGVAAQSRTQNSDAGCRQVTILYTILANCVCNKPIGRDDRPAPPQVIRCRGSRKRCNSALQLPACNVTQASVTTSV